MKLKQLMEKQMEVVSDAYFSESEDLGGEQGLDSEQILDFLTTSQNELLDAVVEGANKLHNKKQSELHGGYDDADYLNAYCQALYDITSLITEARNKKDTTNN